MKYCAVLNPNRTNYAFFVMQLFSVLEVQTTSTILAVLWHCCGIICHTIDKYYYSQALIFLDYNGCTGPMPVSGIFHVHI